MFKAVVTECVKKMMFLSILPVPYAEKASFQEKRGIFQGREMLKHVKEMPISIL